MEWTWVPTDLKEIGWGGTVWIDLAQDWDKRCAVKNTEWTFVFHNVQGICGLAKGLLAS
jgi:hypothetical protein